MDNLGIFFVILGFNGISPNLDKLMVFGAEYLIYLSIILIFILSIKGTVADKKAMLLAILAIPIAILLIKAIHIFIFEPRPYVTYDFSPLIDEKMDASFPSRHATIMAVMAFAYTYLKSRWAPLFLLFMLWVDIARIFVGVHYPLDIVGGLIVGIVSLALALQFQKLLKFSFFR